CNIANRCEGAATERVACNSQACPIPSATEPAWSDWTSWNQCSVSCGRGSQARYRRCATPQNTISYICPGKTMDIRNCEELPCTYNSPNSLSGLWGIWSGCSAACGPGIQTRQRFCTREPCDGSGTQRMACNLRECAQTQWGTWSGWSACSRACGKGLKSRSRACPIVNACAGSSIEQAFCNEQTCTGSLSTGSWSGWSAWGQCSMSCGAGVKRRTRHCQGGSCPGNYRESVICNEGPCANSNANWGGETTSSTPTTITTTTEAPTTFLSFTTTISTTILYPSSSTTSWGNNGVLSSSSARENNSEFTNTNTNIPLTQSVTTTISPEANQASRLRWTLRSSSRDSVLPSGNTFEFSHFTAPRSPSASSSTPKRFSYINGKGLSSARSISAAQILSQRRRL
uniref:Uncharacterized protein n=1 Tax=Panagrolaimus sp. PS1159 TaxID=55785 RepID=A0AC35F9K7_9BILA